MRVFVIIAGLLLALFGGGCLALVPKWTAGAVVVFGWLPILAGIGFVGYSILHKRGTPFPIPVIVIAWVIVLGFIAALVSLFVSVVYFDFRMAG